MKLEKRPGRQTYYVRVPVPRELRRLNYRSHVRKSTGTGDKRQAEKQKGRILSELYREIDRMYLEAGLKAPAWQSVVEDALDIRSRVQTGDIDTPPEDPTGGVLASEVAENEVGPVFGNEGIRQFVRIAEGQHTPLTDDLLEEALSDSALTEQTRANYRGPVKEFMRWRGGSVAVEEVTRKLAGQYVTGYLRASGAQPGTINKKVSALSGLWAWMVKRGYAADNPWLGQQVATKADRRGTDTSEGDERPFTDCEVKAILSGVSDQARADLLHTLMLTGMRLKEAVDLEVRDCGEDWLRVREGKNVNSQRTIPLHPDLRPIIETRRQGKSDREYVFKDIAPEAENRASAFSKWFTRYRRDLEIKDSGAGRREKVNLHSARRWFITKAEEAGYLPPTIAPVVGHGEGRSHMTAHYSGGPGWQTLKSIVESVKLPE